MNFDGLMPGDTIKLTEEFTVSKIETGWGFGSDEINIEEIDDIDVANYEYDIVSQPRPVNWPPQDGDVWKAGNYGVYAWVLGEEFRDSDGDELDFHEWLSDNSVHVDDMKLVFRPGVTDKK